MIVVNGNEYPFKEGVSLLSILKEHNKSLFKEAIVAKEDDKLIDLSTLVSDGVNYTVFTAESPEGLETIRHSAAHIMAQAVKTLLPEAKVTIGPVIENGFFYDFDVENPFTPEQIQKIEKEMKKHVQANYEFHRTVMSRDEAVKHFEALGEIYKVEIIKELPEDQNITFYKQGDFIDLCRGPHIPFSGRLKAFKLLNAAGAYWRGDEKNRMLQRIYGTAFSTKEELDQYLNFLEEAKKRDHRKLGKELDLFSFQKEGVGFVFWHPKGMTLRNQLIQFWRDLHEESGYVEINTPIILNKELWIKSGHYANYKENMYFTQIDEMEHAVKPMNCPGCMLFYNTSLHSYREFPIRVAELGLVHRHERSGTLHGLMRVRQFTQDDAHIFMLPSQITTEIKGVVNLIETIFKKLGFSDVNVEISTRPAKFIGNIEDWDTAEAALKQALDELNYNYEINEGDGAFYGPKIDFSIKDSLNRRWQCSTIQLDFALPERFDCTYIGEDGKKHRPIMIHRAIYGSIERLIGILIEEYAGKFPLWLAPVQMKIIPVSSEKHLEYSQEVYKRLKNSKFRVELDDRGEKLGYKIREAQLSKVPYMLIIGDQEVENQTVAVRHREHGDLGSMSLFDFFEKLSSEL
ncbi:threonine--tRNA ligase [bacterium]|nr:threonine--tRNA ligase [bacterium]